MQRAMASGQRISEVLDVPVDIKDKPGAVSLSRDMDGSVEFRNVTFGYRHEPAGAQERQLPRQSGRDGRAGRPHRLGQDQLAWRWSTGSMTCGTGQVLVGGHDVRDVTQDSLGEQVAMVLQEPFLFTGTVLENIRYNKTERHAAKT